MATLVAGLLHGLAHFARNVYEKHAPYMLHNTMDRSGLTAFVMLVPITIPMLIGPLKSRVSCFVFLM